jgi:phosphoadenosine phosphosulfate reductase
MRASLIAELETTLPGLSPAERLALAARHLPEGLVFSSSLGIEDQVLTDMIARQNLPIRIVTLDTGRLFQETHELIDKTRARYKIPIEVFFPDGEALSALVSSKGMNSFYHSVDDRKACCQVRKVAPLRRALQGASAWITGLRAGQSENRKSLPVVEWDSSWGLLKINPLADWSMEEVEQYGQVHSVPVNPLHGKGYPSIGCAPCTRAIQPGEDLRAGRWWWEQSHKECGLHARGTTN